MIQKAKERATKRVQRKERKTFWRVKRMFTVGDKKERRGENKSVWGEWK